MKLAFVAINGSAWGGSEVLWTATAKLALQNGHEVLVSMYECEALPEPIRELKELGAKFHFRRKFFPALPTRVKKKVYNLFAKKDSQYTYHEYLNTFAPDRILFNLGAGDEVARDSTDLMVFVKQTKIPFFIFCHSISMVPENNKLLNENFRISFSKAKHVFFTSLIQKEMLEHQIMQEIANGKVVSNPVDVRDQEFIEIDDLPAFSLGMVGGLILRQKGHDMVLKILSNAKWSNRDFRLNIYGKGEDREYLEEFVRYYKLEEKVVFHGFEKSMKKIWANNHFHVIPSRQDSGPITLFEAMSCGRPIVGTRMGAIPDYVEDGVNGYLCESGSYASLEAALEKAWKNRELWREMGEQSLKIVKKKYDFESEKTFLNYLMA